MNISLYEWYYLGGGNNFSEIGPSASCILQLGYEKGAGLVAAYNLGRCYYFGRGVEKNLEKARELFKEAEDGGFPVKEKLNEK